MHVGVGILGEFKRGWRTLLASGMGNGAGLSGLPFYTFGVFVLPLVEAFGWQRGRVSIAASFMIIGTAISAPIIGSIIDRFGARRVALLSMSGLGLGYLAMTQLGGNLTLFYAAWLMMALLGAGTTPVVWTRAVNMWFDGGRGLALGLCLGGSGVASIFAPALTTQAIRTYGWQGGYMALGLFILIVAVPIIALLYKDREQTPDVKAAEAAPKHGVTLDESLKTVSFWKIAVGFFFISGVIAGLIINLVPLLVDRGLSQMDAAGIAGIMGLAVLGGRIGVGFLLDRFPAAVVARLLLGLSGAGCFLLTLEGAGTWAAILAVISLGLAAAAEVDLVAFLTSRWFGMKAYGKIYGFQLSAFYLGAAVGPFLTGLAYDAFQSYLQVLYFAAATLVIGALVIGTLGRPPNFAGGERPV
jgi:predicted MFS family arabinose efflux permease